MDSAAGGKGDGAGGGGGVHGKGQRGRCGWGTLRDRQGGKGWGQTCSRGLKCNRVESLSCAQPAGKPLRVAQNHNPEESLRCCVNSDQEMRKWGLT